MTIEDWHYPTEEPAELAQLMRALPVLQSGDSSSVVLRNPLTNATAQVAIGALVPSTVSSKGDGMRVVHFHASTVASAYAVIEWTAAQWGASVFLAVDGHQGKPLKVVRTPIGRLDKLQQPRYTLDNSSDPDWYCKQDIDPTDWLGKLAGNASGPDREATFAAAATVRQYAWQYAGRQAVKSGFVLDVVNMLSGEMSCKMCRQ